MGANELCNALMGIISEETSLLERVATLELTLKQSVVSHDWRALERARAKMAPIFRRLADVEQARAASFEALRSDVQEDEGAGFYEVVVHLDRDQREEAAEAYRALKFTVLKIQGITASIDVYLTTVTGAMQEILSELYPFRRGNIYSRHGTKTQVQSDPMVLNRHL